MTPKLPEEYSDFRRQQILQASWECFAEKGYHEATIREIAKRMNASTGVIYNYFRGKEEILEAIQDWTVENNKQMFNRIGEEDSSREAFLKFYRNSLESCPMDEFKKSARGNIGMWAEALKRENIRKMFKTYYEDNRERLSVLAKEGIENKEISADINPQAMAGFILALMIGLQIQVAVFDGMDTRAYFEEIKKIFFTNVWRDI